MQQQIIILCLLLQASIIYSFPSFSKTLVEEINELDQVGPLSINGWNQSTEYTCGDKNILGRFGSGQNIQKTYTVQEYDYLEISMKFYILDDARYELSHYNEDNGRYYYRDDGVEIRINDTQEQVQFGSNLITGDTDVQSGSNICGDAAFTDNVVIKTFEQFNYASTSVKLEFQTYYRQTVDIQSWGIREISIKLYKMTNLSKVHEITDVTDSATGWTPQFDCGGNLIVGQLSFEDTAEKTYTSLPNYRFVVVSLDLYFIDSPDWSHRDYFISKINDKQELEMYGKNFDPDYNVGVEVCGQTFPDLVDVRKTMRYFGNEKNELKLTFETYYNQQANDESWGFRNLQISFYNYEEVCPSPFVLSDDRTWCNCPANSHLNSAGNDCVFCGANQELNDAEDDCICVNNTFIFNSDESECECPSEQIIENGNCVSCDTQEYFFNDQCLNCDNTQCATCSGTAISCDTDCNNDCAECDSTASCTLCAPQKYLSSGSCLECDNTQCATCTGSATSCDTNCNNDCAECDSTGSCTLCAPQKYLSTGSCLECDNTQCATCSGSATNCVQNCNNDCAECDSTGDCTLCAPQKYLSLGSCLVCDNTQCATCTGSATTCDIDCNSDCNECDSTGSCTACEDGKYLSDGQCLDCDNTVCGTCSGNATNCTTSCQANCAECDITGACTLCNDGKFLSSGQCLDCDNTQCGTCAGQADNCIQSCNSSCAECDITGACTSCDIREFIISGECQSCDFTQCGTCSGSAITCIIPCNNSGCQECDQTGGCTSCAPQRYLDNNQCIDCDNTVCATCTGSATSCDLQCNSDCKQCDSTGVCISCENGEYLSQGQCLACDNTVCGTCQNNSNECIIECDVGCLTCNIDGSCQSCKEGFYVSEDGSCQQCKHDCACVQYDVCSYCFQDDSNLRSPKDCSCKPGYFENLQGNCQVCDSKCEKCEGSADNCTQCKNIESRIQSVQQDCSCKNGYYEDQSTFECQKCPSQCATCDQNQKCTSCLNELSSLPNCITIGTIQNEIQNGDQDLIDSTCSIQCSMCENTLQNCTKCSKGMNRSQNAPDCLCEIGFHDNLNTTKDCQPCPPLCKSCSSSTTCDVCKLDNSELNSFNLQCECKKGFKFDQEMQNCKKCYFYLDNCHFECPDNTKLDKNKEKCIEIKYQKQSHVIIFYICFAVLALTLLVPFLLSKFMKKFSRTVQIQTPVLEEKL